MPLLDTQRGEFGGGSVCHELNIAPSTYYRYQNHHHQHPEKRSQRDRRDDLLKQEIQRVYDENYCVYGAAPIAAGRLQRGQMHDRAADEEHGAYRCARGKKVRTTVSRKTCATHDRVNRQSVAERPNQLWVTDFTYASTWQGFAYVAFIIDVFAGMIVGWRVSASMETTFVLDALEQTLWGRRPPGTIYHSDISKLSRVATHAEPSGKTAS
ncbi:Integrase core domain [Serratia marcescens]|nr:Integrase core domain [Serratia marcescens]CAI1209810.1 Integrase core domain [Serratia marcescens]